MIFSLPGGSIISLTHLCCRFYPYPINSRRVRCTFYVNYWPILPFKVNIYILFIIFRPIIQRNDLQKSMSVDNLLYTDSIQILYYRSSISTIIFYAPGLKYTHAHFIQPSWSLPLFEA